MKHFLFPGVIALGVALSLPALAADMGNMKMDNMNGMKMDGMPMDKKGMDHMPAKMMTGHGVGVVKAVDAKAGTLTISHGPVAELHWPGMTMSFKAAPALLTTVKPGDKVVFTCTAEGMNATVTEIKPAP